MAKKTNPTQQLLAETNPDSLQRAAIGAALSFFVFLGAMVVADASAAQFAGEPGFLLGSILGAL